MKTKQRILRTSLELFNSLGEANVTSLEIATALGISEGNLYYHFKGKDKIIFALYDEFEAQWRDIQPGASSEESALLEIWLYLQLSFELMVRYLFIYRDLTNLLSRYPRLNRRFHRILSSQRASLLLLCSAVRTQGQLRASKRELENLVLHMSVVMNFSLSYQLVEHSAEREFQADVSRAAYQTLVLIAPYLDKQSRAELSGIADSYI